MSGWPSRVRDGRADCVGFFACAEGVPMVNGHVNASASAMKTMDLTERGVMNASHASDLLRREDEHAAAVLLPTLLCVFRAHRRLFALAHRRHAIGGDAEAYEIVLHRARAALAEREV